MVLNKINSPIDVKNLTITAEKDGYVTLYGANHGHIDYLDELAVSLGLR